MAQRLIFGRFLGFVADRNIPRNLSEWKFRGYWSRTNQDETNERILTKSPGTSPGRSRSIRPNAFVAERCSRFACIRQ